MSEIENLEHESPVPRYTERDEHGFSARLGVFTKYLPQYTIVPVTQHPDIADPPSHGRRQSISSTDGGLLSERAAARALQVDIVEAFFASISARDAAAVEHLIRDRGFISPDCPNAKGETPLLASIRSRSAPTARILLTLGADPNLPGKPAAPWDHDDDGGGINPGDNTNTTILTPLMLAATTGQLAIVKLLVGDFHADDSAVGAHGETALWLAARAGHRDVVAYLPARRGGAWKRLRHSKEVRALRRAVVTAGQVVKFVGWTIPRCLVFEIPRGIGKMVWRRRWDIWKFFVRVVTGFPRFFVDSAKGVWKFVKELPRDVRRVVMWIYRAVPRAWNVLRKGLVDAAKKVGSAAAYAAQRLISVLHSFFVAVITRLKEVKLKDLGHDLLVAMKALLVNLPGAIRAFMSESVAVLGRAFKALFTNCLVRTLLTVVTYLVCLIPRTIWNILESLWAFLGRGVEELITLVNPKMVPSRGSRS